MVDSSDSENTEKLSYKGVLCLSRTYVLSTDIDSSENTMKNGLTLVEQNY